MRSALQYTGRNVAMYTAPIAAAEISKFNRGGQGTAWRPSRENVAGLKVDAFMSGVYGYEVPVVVKKDWNDFPTTLKQFGGWIFFVDHDRSSTARSRVPTRRCSRTGSCPVATVSRRST
jgi:hypothetical protein